VRIAHLIFDCDGVLVDSEPLSMRLDVAILAEHGVVMDEAEAHRRFVGKTFAAMLAEVEAETGCRFPADASADKDRRLLALFERELAAVAGVDSILRQIGREPYSVASNSPRQRVAEALRITGLTPWFGDRITTFEDVTHGKPEPDIFIEAARRAATPPGQCLVVEDSVTGVTAAARAGCRVLGFTGTHHEPELQNRRLRRAGAAAVFGRMEALPGLVSDLLGQP